MHLNEGQFKSFKSSVNEQMERKRKKEEEKRLNEAMLPIDQVLENLDNPATHLQPKVSLS